MTVKKLTSRPSPSVRQMVVESIVEVAGLADGSQTMDERAVRELFRQTITLAMSKPSSGVNPRTKLHALEMLMNRVVGPVIQTTANINMNAEVPNVPIDLRDPNKRRLAEQITRDLAGLLGQSGDRRSSSQPG